MKRVAIVCPGRGSYAEGSLGSLPPEHDHVRAAEALRARRELPALVELDRSTRFDPSRHLRPANVAALIYVVSMLDCARASAEGRAVCAAGNSMGWYTALAASGALTFEEGFELVQEMALLQEEAAAGGQVIYPVVDSDWRPAADRAEAIGALLDELPGDLYPSIHLGGYEVLAGTARGVARALECLPRVRHGKADYPLRLARHGPYHTPLAASVSESAGRLLAGLDFRPPRITLIDGRGVRFTPWSTDPAELRDYTLGAQVTTPFDFTASIRVVLREYAPELLVLPGPGNTLGGVCGQIAAREGWRGIRSKADFDALQGGAEPLVLSMGR